MKKAIQIRNATVHLPKLMTWMLVYLFCAAPLFAQTSRVITGIVTDASGETMAGAIANIKNTTTATTTDVKGKFTLTIPGNVENPVLVISYLGYLSQEMTVGNTADFSIVLQENATMLDDVVVVGYGTQKRVTMTSAVSTVKGGEIAKLPVPRVSTGLGGMVSGVVTFQSGGAAPGADAASIYVHGVTPLILVDGVDRPHDRIDTEDIESISVLRDAAAVAPYGLQGANGVILITTKRGAAGKFSATYDGKMSWQTPVNTPEFMGSADYFEFRNKAWEMDGLTGQMMAADEIAKYRSGENPDRYPNTDWVKNYMKTSGATQHNVSVSGGTDKIKAFASLGYVYQNSMFDGQDYRRYTARTNVDIQATATTRVSIDNSFMRDILAQTGLGAAQLMERIFRAVPEEVDRYSNGLSAFQNTLGISMYEAMHNRGEYTEQNDISTSNVTIEQQLPFLKGLSGKVAFNYDKQHKDLKNWILPLVYYNLTDEGEYARVDQSTTVKPTLSEEYKRWDWYTFNGSLNYKNSFGKNHLEALALFEARWTNTTNLNASINDFNFLIPEFDIGSSDKSTWGLSGSSAQTSQYGVVGRVSYNFDQKYMLELAGRYDGSYKYSRGKRHDFFPSVSVGWRISEEPFMEFSRDIVNSLKLRASYGKSGSAVGTEFGYMNNYLVNNSYVWGNNGGVREQGISASVEANADMTWESVWKTNGGFDLNLWNGLLGIEFDAYHEKRTDKLLSPLSEVPYEYGIGLATVNAGSDVRWGTDITLSNNTRIVKDFNLRNTVVFSYTRHRLIENFENQATLYNPRRRTTGLDASQIWGYQSAGLFADEEDVKNWTYQAAGTLPGDIKYVDINGDGKIDSEDIVRLGLSRIPQIMWGYNLGLTWKNIDLALFFQGTGRSDYYLGTSDRGVRRPFAEGKARIDHYNAWTTDNPNPDAKYPRLRSTNFAMNYVTSDFWVINSAYVKLKSIDIGYALPAEWIRKAGMNKLRIGANFYNVWTIFTKADKDFDPEAQDYSVYPQQFISTIKLTATF